jgi:DNA (cytosine-5)-methyltransferase 1
LKIYLYSFEECNLSLERLFLNNSTVKNFRKIVNDLSLYSISDPLIVNASDYGVPQNRERVLFIGCRKDQVLINKIPNTVKEGEKVTVMEALEDLASIGNNETVDDYSANFSEVISKFPRRLISGSLSGSDENRKTYIEWSREGRLLNRYIVATPVYVRDFNQLHDKDFQYKILHNHQMSNQAEKVIKRLSIILKYGNYDKAKNELKRNNLESAKRNYNVLLANTQSRTIVTIPDDFIHYNFPRALTVREMARLQSFDDSFVFQGKRSTGGNMRRIEVPQYTLVGNAIPPLLARAIAMEILRFIK